MSKALANITDTNFELVKQYLHTGSSVALTSEQQYMLDLCLECYGLLKKYPQRNVCINQLMATKGICYNTAAKYVDFCRNTWSNFIDCRREFVETFFIERLMSEITNEKLSDNARAKNLATLEKYLSSMPEQKVDPKLMESNTVNIQVNIAGQKITLPESFLENLPQQARMAILSAFNGDIDDNGMEKLLQS